MPQPTPQFMVLTYDKHGRIDAAAMFQSGAQDAYVTAKRRSLAAGSDKFQLYAITIVDGSPKFSHVAKPKK